MRGEKTVDLGFTFTVGQGDKGYVDVSTVTVRAPGLGKFDVHTTMQAWVSQAVLQFAKMRGDLADAAPDTSDEDADESGDSKDVMTIMAMGLKQDYPTFAAYVKRVLTNSKLATVGDGDAKLGDEAWDEIEAKGGVEAAMKIMSEFTGFFFDALGSQKKTGSGKSRGSSSPSKAASNTKKRETTPG